MCDGKKSNRKAQEEMEEDLDENESHLTIDDSENVSENSLVETPTDLETIIRESGIDEILEEKAKKTKLTANHVKSLIKTIMNDSQVLSFITGTVANTESNIPYEPKFTRSKTKMLIQEQVASSGSEFSGSFLENRQLEPSLNPETKALAIEEFLDDEDDEDYDPDADPQSNADDTDYGSPMTLTPASIAGKSDISSRRTPVTPVSLVSNSNLGDVKAVQRTLNFDSSPLTMRHEQIFNRTRSKYPMTGTALEYLEMNFKPPDITADMYETECDDEIWKDFLVEYCKPADACTMMDENDENIDPEYNLMAEADAAQEVLMNDYQEEMKEFRIPKKEISELMSEFLDYCADDQEETTHEKNDTAVSNLGLSMFNEADIHSNFQYECSPPHIRLDTPDSELATPLSKSVATTPVPVQNSAEVPVPSLLSVQVKFMLPEFSGEHLSTLKSQIMQHLQLLTTSILMVHQTDCVEDSILARNMLNEFASHANQSKDLNTVSQLWHVQACVETVAFYDANKHLEPEYKNFDWRKTEQKCQFSDLIQSIILHSIAFPFPELLPTKRFRTKDEMVSYERSFSRATSFTSGEDWLIAFHLDDIQKNAEDSNIKRGSYKRKAIKFLPTRLKYMLEEVGETEVVRRTVDQMVTRISYLRKRGERCPNSPLLKYLRTQTLDYSAVKPPVMFEGAPCPLKNLPENVFVPQLWMEVRSAYRWQLIAKEKGLDPNKMHKKARSSKNPRRNVNKSKECSSPSPEKENTVEQNTSDCLEFNILPSTQFDVLEASPRNLSSSQSMGIDMPLLAFSPYATRTPVKILDDSYPSLDVTNKNASGEIAVKCRTPEDTGATVLRSMAVSEMESQDEVPLKCNPREISPVSSSICKRRKICEEITEPVLLETKQVNVGKQTPASNAVEAQTKNRINRQDSSDGTDRDDRSKVISKEELKNDKTALHAGIDDLPKQIKSEASKQHDLQSLNSNSEKDPKEHAKVVALTYMKQAKEQLPPKLFEQFMETLQQFNQNTQTPEKLYLRICEVLQDYPSLKDDFIVFLKPKQALKIGKYKEYCSKMNIQLSTNKLQPRSKMIC